MKHSLIVLLLIIALLGCGGCKRTEESKNTDNIDHQLKVTAGKESIKSVVLVKPGDAKLYDEMNAFKYAFEINTSTDIKYIKKGEKVTLNFGNIAPDDVSVKDILLSSDGGNLYSDKWDIDIPLVNEGSNFSFYLEGNPSTGLSSELAPNKKQSRGFKVTAIWGDKEYIYAFVIKSDK